MKVNQNVNYTKHLELFFTYWQEINFTLSSKERFSPIILATYYHLFHQWNHARFPKFLDVHREDIMQSCGIGNHITYTNALKTLETRGLLRYFPSPSRYKASQVELAILTEDTLKTLIATLSTTAHTSEQSTVQTSAQSNTPTKKHSSKQTKAQTTEPTNEQSNTQTTAQCNAQSSAALYKTVETKKQYKQRNGGNAISPPEIFSDNFSLLEDEKKLFRTRL